MLSPKQRAKRRWTAQRTARAQQARHWRTEQRRTTVRYKTKFGILTLKAHPIFMGGARLPAPGFYDLTK